MSCYFLVLLFFLLLYYIFHDNLSFCSRQVDITKSGQGARVSIGHGGTILDNDRHRLDGSGFASKNFRPSGPLTVGGQLDYNHKPTGDFILFCIVLLQVIQNVIDAMPTKYHCSKNEFNL